MFSGKDAANPSYPTQWALNPTAYQNVDSSTVDWAALAQQWIAMKEAAAIIAAPPAAPPPPSMKPDAEEGEAPMEVENPDNNVDSTPAPPAGAEWNSSTNSWGGSWNQWGWGWQGPGVDPKLAPDASLNMPPMMDGFTLPSDNAAPLPGYTSSAAPTFQHGYWTAPQPDTARGAPGSRERRSKSKGRDAKSTRGRGQRDKPGMIPPVIEPIVMPTPVPAPTIDAAKRRQLPAWIREGLEKMEREKQKAIEREEEKKAREEAEREKKRLEEEELERLKAEGAGQPMMPAKSKFDTDSEGESEKESELEAPPPPRLDREGRESGDSREESPQRAGQQEAPLPRRSKEEIMQEVMLTVRRSLTEILLEVTDQEIHMVSQEELARYSAAQASRLNAVKASKSKALAAIASGLGLGAYESSSDESGDEDQENQDITDYQLQEIIRRKKNEFERTAREIEAEVRRAERELAGDHTPPRAPLDTSKHRHESSATPPPLDSETPEKIVERRTSKDKRNNHKSSEKVDGVRKLDSVPDEKSKKSSRKEHTPSPIRSNDKPQSSSTSTSDSEEDSSSNSSESSSSSEPDKTEVRHSKKRRRRSSSSSNSQKKSKKDKNKKEKPHKSDDRNSYSKSKYDDYEKSEKSRSKKRDDYYDKHKSSKSRDYDRRDKYRDEYEDDRPKKRSKRSRSISYESRGRRRSRERSEERSRRRDKRSHDRDRSYDRSGEKYDRYERSRDDRRRSRSHSRHRHRR